MDSRIEFDFDFHRSYPNVGAKPNTSFGVVGLTQFIKVSQKTAIEQNKPLLCIDCLHWFHDHIVVSINWEICFYLSTATDNDQNDCCQRLPLTSYYQMPAPGIGSCPARFGLINIVIDDDDGNCIGSRITWTR